MIGQTLSHYRIVSPLGRGAMGEVYLAEDVRLGRRVAVKLLPADVSSHASTVERFEREARIVSSLNHAHICTLYDIGEHEGRQFMVMELLEGEPLSTRIARGPLPFEDVLAFGADVAGALDAAHHRGVVHRDIKPANLFVTTTSGIKVLDFGVAKLSDVGATDTTSGGTDQLTMVGTAIGTVAYMSPEQARGAAIDARSDLFSLGVVLFEMATGRKPFPGTTAAVVFEGLLTKTPAPPSSVRPDLPDEFDRVVTRALQKDPSARHQSAAELRDELKALQRATDTYPSAGVAAAAALPASSAASVAPPRARRRRLWWLAAPVATAALVAAFVAWQSAGTPALQSKDLVLLASLTNRTGDTMFDDTLGEVLAVQLRQSPFMNLVPDQRVQATLRMMQRPPGTALDAAVGREVCQRVGARALLTSAIASLGSSYVLTLGALDCVTGDTLAEQQTQASRKEDVLKQLGEAARTLREQLGESLASIKRYDVNVEMATTTSLEALKAYSQAIAARRTQGDRAALPLFRRAVELDPEFALAHARLGTSYSNLNDSEGSRRHTLRAYELRNKVSELERLYIEARYYSVVEPDNTKAVEAYRVTLATYPNDYTAHVNLAILLRGDGELEEAITLLRQAVAFSPEEPNARINLASALLQAGRFAEARPEVEQTIAIRDDGAVRTLLMSVAVFSGDAALEQQLRQWAAAADPRDSLQVLWGAALYRGQLREAERLAGDAERVFGSANLWSVVNQFRAGMAASLALTGEAARAQSLVARLETDHPSDDTADERLVVAAFLRDRALARRSLTSGLTRVTDQHSSESVNGFRALGQIAEGQLDQAYQTLGPIRYQIGDTDRVLIHGALALDTKRYGEALKDLEWVRDHGRRELMVDGGVVRFKIAQALEGAGRSADARKAYADFLEFWKAADRDLSVVVEATKALARLSS